MSKSIRESVGTRSLRSSLTRGQEFESFGDALRLRHQSDIENIGGAQRRLGAAASSGVQQNFRSGGGSFAKNLEQTIRRGRARQGVINRGDPAIRNQQLKDRLALAKSSVNRRGVVQGTAESAARLRAGGDIVKRNADDAVSSARFGALGGIAGGLARGFGSNLFSNRGAEIPVAMDQGTAASDFFNGRDLGFNLESNPGVMSA